MEVDLVDAQQTSPETDNTTEMSGDVDAGRNEGWFSLLHVICIK